MTEDLTDEDEDEGENRYEIDEPVPHPDHLRTLISENDCVFATPIREIQLNL